jgi:SEC-C motif
VTTPPRFDDPLELLAASPEDEYAMLELALEWDDAVGPEARLAAALRLFVITRDPLDWLPERSSAWATANADGDALELPVYVTRAEVQRRLATSGGDIATAVGPLGETVVLAAARYQGIVLAGAYPELAFRGEIPSLLARRIDAHSLGPPVVSARSAEWEPIGLGAIQDLVQEVFRPVDFDRSSVALPPSCRPDAGCPACAGGRFGFPGDLAEATPAMCGTHRAQANDVTASRIARARTSNPAGWRAIGEGSARINHISELGGGLVQQRRRTPAGRNNSCPCGSGRKYKHCCAN